MLDGGLPVTASDAPVEEAQAELHSPLYQGGVAVSGGGILDPVKLVDALRQEAERLGVRVYEKSPVRSFHRNGSGIVVKTLRAHTPTSCCRSSLAGSSRSTITSW